MNNPGVKYGLIGGAIATLITFTLWFAMPMALASLWTIFLLMIIYIILARRAAKERKTQLNGLISLKDAFLPAFICFAIATGIDTVGSIVAFELIDSSMKDKIGMQIVENTIDTMKSFGAPTSEIDKFLDNDAKEMPRQFDGANLAIGWVKYQIFLAVIALIIGAVLKSKRHELDSGILDA